MKWISPGIGVTSTKPLNTFVSINLLEYSPNNYASTIYTQYIQTIYTHNKALGILAIYKHCGVTIKTKDWLMQTLKQQILTKKIKNIFVGISIRSEPCHLLIWSNRFRLTQWPWPLSSWIRELTFHFFVFTRK